LFQARRLWNHLPGFLRRSSLGQVYGRHLHAVVRFHSERSQSFGTFFLRNRAELELMCRLLDSKPYGATLDICVLACSKGAEVYSILWAIRSVRPDLKVTLRAVDISQEILEFAERGVYYLAGPDASSARKSNDAGGKGSVDWNTSRDQIASIFERMTDAEVEAMFEIDGDQARVRSWLKEDIIWLLGDAGDAEFVRNLGPQEVVVANRFLCHMTPGAAERCLRNIARLVKPGGYVFVSGIDLDVRTKVAQDMGWNPVTDLIREVHEGDSSLRNGWPLEYWALEPFCDDRPDWKIRYASVFRVGEVADSGTPVTGDGAPNSVALLDLVG
jgi:chemotaxis methyl-accepting protein methylase